MVMVFREWHSLYLTVHRDIKAIYAGPKTAIARGKMALERSRVMNVSGNLLDVRSNL